MHRYWTYSKIGWATLRISMSCVCLVLLLLITNFYQSLQKECLLSWKLRRFCRQLNGSIYYSLSRYVTYIGLIVVSWRNHKYNRFHKINPYFLDNEFKTLPLTVFKFRNTSGQRLRKEVSLKERNRIPVSILCARERNNHAAHRLLSQDKIKCFSTWVLNSV
jgi:hypothetical protein